MNDDDAGATADRQLDPSKNPRLKKFAELEVERQSLGIERLLNQLQTDFNWLTASLMLLNSGGAVAVLNAASVSVLGKQIAGSIYVLGVILALAVARTSQWITLRAIAPQVGYRAFWISVSQGEIFDAVAEKEAIGKVQLAARYA